MRDLAVAVLVPLSNRSITRVAFFVSASRNCSATLLSLSSSMSNPLSTRNPTGRACPSERVLVGALRADRARRARLQVRVQLTVLPRRSSFESSFSSRCPDPSGSHESNSRSTSSAGASNFISPHALWNSARLTLPLLSSSHSRNRSITRTDAFDSASRSCSATVFSEDSSMSRPCSSVELVRSSLPLRIAIFVPLFVSTSTAPSCRSDMGRPRWRRPTRPATPLQRRVAKPKNVTDLQFGRKNRTPEAIPYSRVNRFRGHSGQAGLLLRSARMFGVND